MTKLDMANRLLILVLAVTLEIKSTDADCTFPTYYDGTWYHRETGDDVTMQVKASTGSWDNKRCVQNFTHTRQNPGEGGDPGLNMTFLLQASDRCFMCLDVIYRSIFILQFKKSDCLTRMDITLCDGIDKLPEHAELTTLFKQVSPSMDCIASIEGLFQFSYEINELGGGICNNSGNLLEACQTPGSPNYDNKDFVMKYKQCPDIQNSFTQQIRYKCMGTWTAVMDNNVYTFVGLAWDETGVLQDKYKCLMTLRDQHSEDNTIRWGLSRFGDCRNLKSLEQSPIRIVLRKIAPSTSFMSPQCSLPRNLTGNWFTEGMQFSSNVWINETHIYYRTSLSQFEYEEVWFTCLAHLGTRYLMSKVVVGRCEVSFICFDLVPRHQGIIRYRVGRSAKLPFDVETRKQETDFLPRAFRETCNWQWLTFSRQNVDWKYEVLIQNPPSPFPCPVGGRFTFTQFADDDFQLYDTRIRGVTLSPRHSIECPQNVSEFKSCAADVSKIEIDAWYCETVDYRGRPIGEYDEPDHVLTCVGYWLEDMRSYLVTYDEEDAVSKFRCWVYERVSWTDVALSRSETARCQKDQEATSYRIDGARLHLRLSERERLFDDCPPRFDSGIQPHIKTKTVYTLWDGAGCCLLPSLGVIAALVIFQRLVEEFR